MNFHVYNRDIQIINIDISAVASSSLVIVGDGETFQLWSKFDTPPDSLIIGPFIPLNRED